MKLGDFYSKYHVFIGSIKGEPVRRHSGNLEYSQSVQVTDFNGHEFTFDFSDEVEIRDDKFFIDTHQINFVLKRIQVTPDMFDEAVITNGYIAVDIKAKKRRTR